MQIHRQKLLKVFFSGTIVKQLAFNEVIGFVECDGVDSLFVCS